MKIYLKHDIQHTVSAGPNGLVIQSGDGRHWAGACPPMFPTCPVPHKEADMRKLILTMIVAFALVMSGASMSFAGDDGTEKNPCNPCAPVEEKAPDDDGQ